MNFTCQTYLHCYNSLHSLQISKEANKKLLQINQSKEAWKIAEELMMQQPYVVHGSQLLSQKLNSPLPQNVDPEILAQFILSVKPLTDLHWLCLAKLFIHTHNSLDSLIIEGCLNIDVKLNILKQIPHALTQMRIQIGIKTSTYNFEVYNQNKHLILQSIKLIQEYKNNLTNQILKLKDILIQTLESFSLHRIPLNSEVIAQFILMQCDTDKSSNLLQHIFLQENYPKLEEKLEAFLRKNIEIEKKDWLRAFYLNFYSKKDIFGTFTIQKYTQILHRATQLLTENTNNQEFKAILSDSYDFWVGLISKILKTSENEKAQFLSEKETILKQSLLLIYETLCKHSKLKKCPSVIKVIESKLDIIDLDSEEGLVQPMTGKHSNQEFDELNFAAIQIRQSCIDLIVRIVQGLKTDCVLYSRIFQTLQLLALDQQNCENIELAIFMVDEMIDFCDQSSGPYLSQLVKIILSQKSRLNEYLCQKIVILLGKISKIIALNVSLLPQVFDFFSITIMYDKLSTLASQSLNDLMDQYEAHDFAADKEFKENSQAYLNFWFETFYQKMINEKVIENITKALVIFIYKFKGPESYKKFLQMMNTRIKNLQDVFLQDVYLESIITGQNWINCRQNEEIKPYLIPFSVFMDEFIEFMIGNCFKVNRKPEFTKAINRINWAIKAGCFYSNISKWVQMLKQIIQRSLFEFQDYTLPVGLTPLVYLLKNSLLTPNHEQILLITLRDILPQITQRFISFHQLIATIQYNFTKYILQLHNLAVKLILKSQNKKFFFQINYNPISIFHFIKERILKNKVFWEYEVYKQVLIYFNELVLFNYQIEDICFETLSVCGNTLESLWIQTENIFYNIYKKGGLLIFANSLQKLKPQILPPNPLFTILEQGLQKNDRKMLKSFARCL